MDNVYAGLIRYKSPPDGAPVLAIGIKVCVCCVCVCVCACVCACVCVSETLILSVCMRMSVSVLVCTGYTIACTYKDDYRVAGKFGEFGQLSVIRPKL